MFRSQRQWNRNRKRCLSIPGKKSVGQVVQHGWFTSCLHFQFGHANDAALLFCTAIIKQFFFQSLRTLRLLISSAQFALPPYCYMLLLLPAQVSSFCLLTVYTCIPCGTALGSSGSQQNHNIPNRGGPFGFSPSPAWQITAAESRCCLLTGWEILFVVWGV